MSSPDDPGPQGSGRQPDASFPGDVGVGGAMLRLSRRTFFSALWAKVAVYPSQSACQYPGSRDLAQPDLSRGAKVP